MAFLASGMEKGVGGVGMGKEFYRTSPTQFCSGSQVLNCKLQQLATLFEACWTIETDEHMVRMAQSTQLLGRFG